MGLLRDTYIINNDKSGQDAIAKQIEQKNEIAKEQLIFLKNSRDRVDISLQEYQKLKKDLQEANCIINEYQEFVHQLAKAVNGDPRILLKSKIVYNSFEKQPQFMNAILYIGFEIEQCNME